MRRLVFALTTCFAIAAPVLFTALPAAAWSKAPKMEAPIPAEAGKPE